MTNPVPPRHPADPRSARADAWADEAETEDFKPLTHEEATQWRARQPGNSVWRVVRWQVALTVLAALAGWGLTLKPSVAWSVLYGGLCIALPTALMAYGLTSSALSRWLGASRPHVAGASLAGLFFWEGIKILLALAMMWSAPQVVPELSWLGLVAGLVVALKAYWLAFWLGRKPVG